MRIQAYLLVLFAVLWFGFWLQAPTAEGRVMRPLAAVIAIAGCIQYVRAVRHEASQAGRRFQIRQLFRTSLLGLLGLVALVAITVVMYRPHTIHTKVSRSTLNYWFAEIPFREDRLTQVVFYNGEWNRVRTIGSPSNMQCYAVIRPFDRPDERVEFEGVVTDEYQIWQAKDGTFVPSDERATLEELQAFLKSTQANRKARTLEKFLSFRKDRSGSG